MDLGHFLLVVTPQGAQEGDLSTSRREVLTGLTMLNSFLTVRQPRGHQCLTLSAQTLRLSRLSSDDNLKNVRMVYFWI